MKRSYVVVLLLLFVSILGTAVLLILSPDVIPAHYNFAGEIDRYGSKYEMLIFPAITVLTGGILLAAANAQRKKERVDNEKVFLAIASCMTGIFTAMGLFFGIKDVLMASPDSIGASLDENKFTSLMIGALLIILGNIMPKANRNSAFGLRTGWSMANDRVWQKSQRFGGISAVICGLSMIVLSVFLPGMWNIVALLILVIAWAIVCVSASYKIYKEDVEASKHQN